MLLMKLKFGLFESPHLLLQLLFGTGVFMKKFSFGDEEGIRVGKKLIHSSLFSYAFILVVDLVLSAIQLLVSKGGEV